MSCYHRIAQAYAASTPEERALYHVRRLRGFYHHVFFFVLINAGLAAINLLSRPEVLWFQWPLLGWGIGLALHGLSMLRRRPWLGADWEARKVREYLESEKTT